jgi:hypothetical protein
MLCAFRSHAQLAGENLFLRKKLALFLERRMKPHRADDATRITLVALSPFVVWRHLLTIVKPDTLIRWHRKGSGCFGVGNRARRAGHRFQQTSGS